jgi:hypothetical protein
MQIDLDWRQYNAPEWQGVTCQVRPLEAWAFQQCMRVLQKHKATEGDKSGNMDFFADDGTRDTAEKILRDHVRSLTGIDLKIDGKTRPAEVADLAKYGPLFPLALTVMAHLISISTLTETEAGNSSARRDNS